MMFLCLLWGLTITQNSIRIISDLDRSCLTDTRSAENGSIGADTNTVYRTDTSLQATASLHLFLNVAPKSQNPINNRWIQPIFSLPIIRFTSKKRSATFVSLKKHTLLPLLSDLIYFRSDQCY